MLRYMLTWYTPLNADSPVTTVSDFVGAEPKRHPPPRRTPSTLTHPPPTDAFLTPAHDSLPICACLHFFRSCPRSAPPAFPSRYFLRSCPCSPHSPTLCRSPRHRVLRSNLTYSFAVWCQTSKIYLVKWFWHIVNALLCSYNASRTNKTQPHLSLR